MTMTARDGIGTLTEKEKQTLRLIVRGHDAKSTARSLNLSVHTINERLRDARRKMAVSSSREAARILFEAEGDALAPPPPEFPVDAGIGEDAPRAPTDQDGAPSSGVGPAHRRPALIVGVLSMTLALALLALAAVPQTAPTTPPSPAASSETPDAAVVDTARQWLALLDQFRWAESYRLTGRAFRKLNTVQAWTAASNRARVPLGAVVSRGFDSQQYLPAPPAGYEVVKFRTNFANKAGAVETVTLVQEGGAWRVVGVTVG
ncbi:helix-turn-helix domain-containing protein [Sphingomonas sp. PAMC 26621]|uniref:helix-turn-helix domain-containing protein n=1 Tax=Sphingomonas sp. PAMC 26621 TaxID=1112213 RepID=UPI000289ADF3